MGARPPSPALKWARPREAPLLSSSLSLVLGDCETAQRGRLGIAWHVAWGWAYATSGVLIRPTAVVFAGVRAEAHWSRATVSSSRSSAQRGSSSFRRSRTAIRAIPTVARSTPPARGCSTRRAPADPGGTRRHGRRTRRRCVEGRHGGVRCRPARQGHDPSQCSHPGGCVGVGDRPRRPGKGHQPTGGLHVRQAQAPAHRRRAR